MRRKMGEIESESESESELHETRASSSCGDETVVEITLKTIGPSPASRFSVPSPIKVLFGSHRVTSFKWWLYFARRKVCDLRKLIAQNRNWPAENSKLIWRGNVLHDFENGATVTIQLKSGDSIIVAAKPKPPPKHVRDDVDDEEEEDDLRFQIPPSTSRWKRKLFSALHHKLKLPGFLLMAILSISLKMWIVIVTWFILAPVAHKFELGPLYILGTGFAIIFYNLGKRQPGDISAYSVFNEDFRELPGTFNAERVDRDIRAGQF